MLFRPISSHEKVGHAVGHRVVQRWNRVAVPVQCEHDRGVPTQLLNDIRVGPLAQGKGRGTVPQVVDTDG